MSSSQALPELEAWARARLPDFRAGTETHLTLLAGDASSRRYFRLDADGASYILVEAPPATEKNEAFIAVREELARAGVRVPGIFAADTSRGFLLLEDLGDRLLLPELSDDNVDGHYHRALGLLLVLASARPDPSLLPVYDDALLAEELGRFRQWFVEGLLGCDIDGAGSECIEALCRQLIDSALEQPRVLVHRDFHSRNLMLQDNGELAVIDFQDAVIGPVTYDPVSLLRDCYIRWPAGQVRQWALSHRDALRRGGYIDAVGDGDFLRWFDWMGLQRHLKVLGTFARLYLRDGKAAYLQDLPLVVHYVREVLDRYAGDEAAFSAFAQWFEIALVPAIEAEPWSTAS